ncbi:hypothetical protein HYY69_03140 [Candidatus Woesearchaeota archaeon]|nr:hypothetical protein [Candidatus Woesearchaeota archaeon]
MVKKKREVSVKHLAVVATVAILSLLLMVKTTMNVQETNKDLSGQATEIIKAPEQSNNNRYWLRLGETKSIDGTQFTIIAAKESDYCNIKINDDATWLRPGQSDSNSYGTVKLLMVKTDVASPNKQPICVIEYNKA